MMSSIKTDPDEWPVLISCGILKKEIKQLVHNNQWLVKLQFLDSSLHIDFDRLSKSLTRALSKKMDRKTLVMYGTCHPKMDDIIMQANAIRTPGQNCVEILLGRDRFTHELSKGAFFLFEDWARRWEKISYSYFGNWEIMREIFQDAHNYILCIKTPCSGNFENHANKVSLHLGLPLVWESIGLEYLEKTLESSIVEVIKGNPHD